MMTLNSDRTFPYFDAKQNFYAENCSDFKIFPQMLASCLKRKLHSNNHNKKA